MNVNKDGYMAFQVACEWAGPMTKKKQQKPQKRKNKAGYTATPVACGWAGALIEVTISFGQEQ